MVDPFKPVELSMLVNRARGDGDWSTTIAPKAKMNLVPTGIGKFGFSLYAGGQFDASTGENLTAFAVIPATFRLSETMRINLNGGWLWDRTVDRHYLTYGLGFDWKFTDTLQWTIEGFGQAGASDIPGVVRPRSKPAFATGPTRFFPSISSTATISPARTPIGSPSARRFAFPCPKENPRASGPAICDASVNFIARPAPANVSSLSGGHVFADPAEQ